MTLKSVQVLFGEQKYISDISLIKKHNYRIVTNNN